MTLPSWRIVTPSLLSKQQTSPVTPQRSPSPFGSYAASASRLTPDRRPRPTKRQREVLERSQRLRESAWNDDPLPGQTAPHRQWFDRETLIADAAERTTKGPIWSTRFALAGEGMMYKESSRRRALQQQQMQGIARVRARQLRNRLESAEGGPRREIALAEGKASRQMRREMRSENELVKGQQMLLARVHSFISDLKREEEAALDPIRAAEGRLRVVSEEGARRLDDTRAENRDFQALLLEAEQDFLELTWVRKGASNTSS